MVKARAPEIGDTVFHGIDKSNDKVFEKLYKKYIKEENKAHVYVIRPKFRHAIFKNSRFCYKTVVVGFYIDTQLPQYKHGYVDLKGGRIKTYDAEQKAWLDLHASLANEDQVPLTDRDHVAILQKKILGLEKQLADKAQMSKEIGDTAGDITDDPVFGIKKRGKKK